MENTQKTFQRHQMVKVLAGQHHGKIGCVEYLHSQDGSALAGFVKVTIPKSLANPTKKIGRWFAPGQLEAWAPRREPQPIGFSGVPYGEGGDAK